MPHFDLICLANSRKLGGRCVAGLEVNGSGWVRAVSKLPDGTLSPADYALADGTEAGLLDVIRVGMQAPRPAPHQPENWVIDDKPWKLLSRPLDKTHVPVLRNAVVPGPELLQGLLGRVPYESFQQQKATASLALVAPESLFLYHELSSRGRAQARGRFYLGTGPQSYPYDLSITDPQWQGLVNRQGPRTLQQAEAKFLLTISLGEPFGPDSHSQECYKLIAAIIFLPLF